MAINDNQRRGAKFRELVALLLRADGHEVTFKQGTRRPLSVAILDDERGDIRGLPGWLVNTRSESTNRDLSGACDEARRDAEQDGRAYSATVFSRPQRPAEESFVVMTLDTFSRHILDHSEQQAS